MFPVAQVEVDVLTGEMEILRVDIMYDGGIPLNPAIDLGQIEGSFVQGIGMMHNENYIRDTVTGMIRMSLVDIGRGWGLAPLRTQVVIE